jgi:alpha/beta superfamily hydrolase
MAFKVVPLFTHTQSRSRSFRYETFSDHLTRRGVAVLRYDSRGVGGSSGAPYQFTIPDVAEDALAAIRYLKTRNDINPAQIGLCGQSQGAVVAPLPRPDRKT